MANKKGFSLIEVLIAMLVLTVGLLGLATLQASSLKNNQSAYYRSQATQLAYDIADRMRVNSLAKEFYLSSNKVPSAAQNQASACIPSVPTTTCMPEKMAEHDLYEWNQALTSLLPNGTGRIGVMAVAGLLTYVVMIDWDDNRDGDVDGHEGATVGDVDKDGDTDDDPYFQMGFRL